LGFTIRIKSSDVFFLSYSKSAHNNAITKVELTSVLYRGKPTSIIISIGKDGFLKLWDAENNLCLSVVSTQTTEALSFSYNA
jgi:WD40 repeat protein